MNILSILEYNPGIQNAITGKQLSLMLGISIKRVGAEIRQLRFNGNAICSNDNGVNMGYYIPATREEAGIFFKSTMARARSTFITCANVAKALNAKFGVDTFQLKMELS
jgi:biotin operon repressor